MLINAWVATVTCSSVASVRKRLLASGIERGRTSVQEYMKTYHWPAKQLICVEIHFSLPFLFRGSPTNEESAPGGAKQAAPPAVVHIDVAAVLARRRKKPLSESFSCKTRSSRSFQPSFRTVSSHSVKRSSRRSASYNFMHVDRSFSVFWSAFGVCSFCVSVLLVVSMMLIASCVHCKLHEVRNLSQFSWLIVSSCSCSRVAAPRRCLVRRVLFSKYTSSPTIRIRGWVTVDVSFSQLPQHILLNVTAVFIFHAVIAFCTLSQLNFAAFTSLRRKLLFFFC